MNKNYQKGGKIKTFLCVEDGEEFTIEASNLSEAESDCEMWNAQVIREINTNEEDDDESTITRISEEEVTEEMEGEKRLDTYTIEYWETEDDRDEGYGQMYMLSEEEQVSKEKAIQRARNLFSKQNFSAVEVLDEINSAVFHISTDNPKGESYAYAKGGEISEAKLKKILKDDDVNWSSDKEFFEIAKNRGFDYDDEKETFVSMKTYNEGVYSDKDYAKGDEYWRDRPTYSGIDKEGYPEMEDYAKGGVVKPKNLAFSDKHYHQLDNALDKVINHYGEKEIKDYLDKNKGQFGRYQLQKQATNRISMSDDNLNIKSGRFGIAKDDNWRKEANYTDKQFDSAVKSILRQRLGVKNFAKGGTIKSKFRDELEDALSSLDSEDYNHFVSRNGFEQIDIPNIDAQEAEIESFINGNNFYEKPLTAKQMKEFTEEINENIEDGRYETYYKKGGKVKKKGNEMIIGGFAGFLLGMFFIK